MATGTKIQWADDTVNPTMGCDGCELWSDRTGVHRCYAGRLHRRLGVSNPGYAPTFEQVTLFPGRMEKAARQGDLTGRQRRGKPWLDGCPRSRASKTGSPALSVKAHRLGLGRLTVSISWSVGEAYARDG